MDDCIECTECGWTGIPLELVAMTDDINDMDFTHCPYCGETEFEDLDEDLEDD